MFNNMTFPARMFSAFMFLGLIVLIVALFGRGSTSRLSNHIQTLSANSLPSVLGLWEVNERQTQIESSERALIDPKLILAERQAEIARIRRASEQIDGRFSQYEVICGSLKKR
ncbi:MCP four helix bundle domain-containing protein [Kamptonema formosum]|uniref:MCP four helix bundle domain-containing protein n=1 Tax=Kamptonema formosum TaxID=331992 RepID=UPI00034AEA66|nr:MCP four helix bundle domain-containing protein [Oscillatoria sp. PCC 10802]